MFTGEGGDDYLSEEGYDGEHEPRGAIEFTVHAHALYNGGCMTIWVRSVLLFKSVNIVSGWVVSMEPPFYCC